jgi:Domain of unknown function (DUF1707)
MAAGGGHVRASRADRERAIDVLKAAFVEERLTRDELDVRAGQVYTSLTYAELAVITADLPAAPRAPAPLTPAPLTPARPPAERPPLGRAKKAVLIGVMLTFQPILFVLAILLNNDGAAKVVGLSLPVYFIFVTAAGFVLIESLHERRKRARGQAPLHPA